MTGCGHRALLESLLGDLRAIRDNARSRHPETGRIAVAADTALGRVLAALGHTEALVDVPSRQGPPVD